MIDDSRSIRQQRLESAAAVSFIVLCIVGSVVGVAHLWERVGGTPLTVRAAVPKPPPRIPPLPAVPVDITGAISKGSPAAKVVVIGYSDFKCPYCRTFARDTWPDIDRKYVDTGKIRFVFRNLPLDQLHPFARPLAQAGVCADRQGKFWAFHDLLFERQALLDTVELERAVKDAGLDSSKLQACLKSEAGRRVQDDEAAGRPLGVTGTPTFFVGIAQPDGKILLKQRLSGAQPLAQFQAAVDKLLGEVGAQ